MMPKVSTKDLKAVPPQETALRRAAKAMRALAMASPDGELLGSEDELISRFGVSRPTLRLAAAQVAQEHLITIKRGVNGGYFARIPSSRAVSRVAALYLQRHGARLGDIMDAIQPIRAALVRLAARKRSAERDLILRDFLEAEHSHAGEIDYRYFLRSERHFGHMLSDVSGNRVLGLFLNIIYDVAAQLSRNEDIYVNRPERVDQYRLHRNRMAEAILEGDEDMAELASLRCSEIVRAWLKNEVEVSDFDERHHADDDMVVTRKQRKA